MKPLSFKSIRGRLTFWFLFLSLTPLVIGFLITYNQQKRSLEQENINKLTAIRDLKVQELNKWLTERFGDVRVMAGDYEVRGLEFAIDSNIKSSEELEKIHLARELLKRNQRNYDDYEEIFIVGAKTGIVELSSNIIYEGNSKTHDSYYTVPMETGEIYIKNIYYSQTMSKPQMTFSIPIYCLKHNRHIIGILVARINLEKSLYKLLLNRVGLGETGETLIVDEDVIALNELRYFDNAPLNLKILAEPAIKASQGLTGITVTDDYRGEEILAAYTHIPETGWGFVCKQDKYELDAPLRNFVWNIIVLFIVSGLLIVLIVFWVIRRITKPIVEMDIAAQKIKAGDYSIRTKVSSRDELFSLSTSINEMTAAIYSRITTQQAVSDISDTMIGQSSMQQFGSELLKQLMTITDANMSTFYILNEASLQYEHFTSIGANEDLLEPFNSINPEGEIGNAISTKNIYYLRNIQESTIFKYKTIAGAAIPKEIITIPIIIEGTVVALISLVNINKFNEISYEVVKQSWSAINTSYSNLLSNERTRIFAEQLSLSNQQLEVQTEELQDQAEELQEQTEELQHTSEELQEQNLELDMQKKEVEAANKLKSEFLSNMSHELRTPLNSIMALSRVLIMQAGDKLTEEENGYLEIIERNGKRLLSLINDILDLSKIESGKMEVFPEFVSMGTLLQMIKENMQYLAEERSLDLTLDIPDNFPRVETDESKLHQVLTNVVGNAIKFTEKGSVDISVTHDSTDVHIVVKDTGVGISKEELVHIFEEFRQADGTTSRKFEGTGLGLAIAIKMTAILGGDIKAISTRGKGSVFTITIPIKWNKDDIHKESLLIETNDLEKDKDLILVVDDDPIIVRHISEYLHESGYTTISASTGKKAIELAEKYSPFAITLDIVMPEMDGWEVLQKLKANQITKDIPVIVISVSDDRDTGFALGAIGYINKPIDKNLLLSEVYSLQKRPTSVMIVDDNDFDRQQAANIIEAEDINTVLASGGKECIKLLEDKIPDILILDLMMPEMDGFKVLDEIRKRPKTKDLPVIVVTAKDLTADDKAKLTGKISSVIAKSESSAHELFAEIKRILRELKQTKKDDISSRQNSKIRILMVEDNPEAIIQVKAVLEKEEYNIDIADGGQQALDYIKHTIPDGIILDLMMPDVDGFDVLEKLRSIEITKNIPVLILTAKDLTKSDLAKLNANNVQQLIYKGDVDIKGLLKKVRLMLGNEPIIQIKDKIKNKEVKSNDEKGSFVKLVDKDGMPSILIVEDNADNMITIKAILKGKYTIYEAVDAEIGLKIANDKLPDLILLDISLPNMDGVDVVKELKENENTKYIPVIAVTAQAMIGDKEKILNEGCEGYVSKPIDQKELLREIESLLS